MTSNNDNDDNDNKTNPEFETAKFEYRVLQVASAIHAKHPETSKDWALKAAECYVKAEITGRELYNALPPSWTQLEMFYTLADLIIRVANTLLSGLSDANDTAEGCEYVIKNITLALAHSFEVMLTQDGPKPAGDDGTDNVTKH